MIENSNILGENILLLREFHNESQTDLAKIIGKSLDSVSKYERGLRAPKKETLKLIAKHYGLSINTIMNSVLTIKYLEELNHDIRDKISLKSFKSILTQITSSEAETNNNFIIAQKCFFHILETDTPMDCMFIECKQHFYKSFQEENLLEGAANTIMILFWEFIYRITPPNIFKTTTLINLKLTESMTEDIQRNMERIKPSFIEENNEAFSSCLWALKHNTLTAELADYYIALKYLFNLVDNDNSYETNSEIGLALLFEFADLDNEYAINFLKFIHDFIS